MLSSQDTWNYQTTYEVETEAALGRARQHLPRHALNWRRRKDNPTHCGLGIDAFHLQWPEETSEATSSPTCVLETYMPSNRQQLRQLFWADVGDDALMAFRVLYHEGPQHTWYGSHATSYPMHEKWPINIKYFDMQHSNRVNLPVTPEQGGDELCIKYRG